MKVLGDAAPAKDIELRDHRAARMTGKFLPEGRQRTAVAGLDRGERRELLIGP